MGQASKRTSHHLVAEVPGLVERGNTARQFLNDAEVTTPPCHFVTKPEQPACFAGHSSLTAGSGRRNVRFNTSRQIEAHARRRRNVQLNIDAGHRLSA
jgi:hypothetical protein